jgi:hypothetical protein
VITAKDAKNAKRAQRNERTEKGPKSARQPERPWTTDKDAKRSRTFLWFGFRTRKAE